MKYIYVLAVVVFGATLTRAQTVTVWLTTHDLSTKLAQEASVSFATTNGGSNPVWVDETQTYQQIEGFGASFTDSAAYLLKQVAIPAARSNAMNNLFTHNGGGIGVSFIRNPMAASDLALTHYSYDDNPPGGTDPNLTHFSISYDQADIIPLVQQALPTRTAASRCSSSACPGSSITSRQPPIWGRQPFERPPSAAPTS